MAVSATRVCARCATHDSEVAYCAAVDAWVCLGCYLTSTPPEPRGRAGACPRCGEPRGGRYEGLCWTCWAKDHPEPTRPRPKPAEATVLVERVWVTLQRYGTVSASADGSGGIQGWCPACAVGTVSVAVLRNPVRLRTDGCSAGCSAQAVAEALA